MGRMTQNTFKRKGGYGYSEIETDKPEEISIGFEWEVPCSWDRPMGETLSELVFDEYFLENQLDRYSLDFVDMYHFSIHSECGGNEFASPVFRNLGQSKAVARKLIKRMSKDKYVLDEPGDCGIHVHTQHSSWNSFFNPHNLIDPAVKVWGMLNRCSSSNFVWDFSGRDYGDEEYYHQGESQRWDCRRPDSWSCAKRYFLDYGENNGMLYRNGYGTLEYRLWASLPEKLIPALEFAHATTTFVVGIQEERVPYLSEFKDWLFKTKGYNTLKKQPEWKGV